MSLNSVHSLRARLDRLAAHVPGATAPHLPTSEQAIRECQALVDEARAAWWAPVGRAASFEAARSPFGFPFWLSLLARFAASASAWRAGPDRGGRRAGGAAVRH